MDSMSQTEGESEPMPLAERQVTELLPFPIDEPGLELLAGVIKGVAERRGVVSLPVLELSAVDYVQQPVACAGMKAEVLAIGSHQKGTKSSAKGSRSGKRGKGGSRRPGRPGAKAPPAPQKREELDPNRPRPTKTEFDRHLRLGIRAVHFALAVSDVALEGKEPDVLDRLELWGEEDYPALTPDQEVVRQLVAGYVESVPTQDPVGLSGRIDVLQAYGLSEALYALADRRDFSTRVQLGWLSAHHGSILATRSGVLDLFNGRRVQGRNVMEFDGKSLPDWKVTAAGAADEPKTPNDYAVYNKLFAEMGMAIPDLIKAATQGKLGGKDRPGESLYNDLTRAADTWEQAEEAHMSKVKKGAFSLKGRVERDREVLQETGKAAFMPEVNKLLIEYVDFMNGWLGTEGESEDTERLISSWQNSLSRYQLEDVTLRQEGKAKRRISKTTAMEMAVLTHKLFELAGQDDPETAQNECMNFIRGVMYEREMGEAHGSLADQMREYHVTLPRNREWQPKLHDTVRNIVEHWDAVGDLVRLRYSGTQKAQDTLGTVLTVFRSALSPELSKRYIEDIERQRKAAAIDAEPDDEIPTSEQP